MKQKISIEKTEDGSCTLYVPVMNEHYHSIKGAFTESQHIFINMGLKYVSAENPDVLEIGFGTGLNAFLTLLAAGEMKKHIHYTTLELYPLDESIVRLLNYPETINSDKEQEFNQLHLCKWEETNSLTSYFTFKKVKADYTSYSFEANRYDVIYFDAFAPEKQPEMWEQDLFNSLFNSLRAGGVITTYCAKGIIRRMLQSSGFKVERLPGPPGGKREILRGIKL